MQAPTSYELCYGYFEKKNPRGCALLSLVDAKRLELCNTPHGVNLRDQHNYYHDVTDPLGEALSVAKTIEAAGQNVVCVWGVGLGYIYKALIPWLHHDRERTLVFLEDDLAVIEQFFHTPLALQLLEDPQVRLYYIEDSPEAKGVFEEIIWGVFPQKPFFAALPYYSNHRKETLQAIHDRLEYEYAKVDSVVSEFQIYGAPFVRNFWRNLFLLPESKNGAQVKNAFSGLPAIVVAAGPSLEKNLDHLKTLRDKAIIFAGGTAVNILAEHGIEPHFCAGVDPNSYQYLRLRQSMAFEVPFFWRCRLFHEALECVSGPRIYLKGGDGYDVATWFEKKLHITGKTLEGGHSVSNLLVELASFCGCSPIILVGLDLAYGHDRKHYARDLAFISPQEKRYQEEIEWKNREGNAIITQWKWVVEAEWIEQFAKKHRKVKFVNATEGGIGFTGIPRMSLRDAEREFLRESYDVDAMSRAVVIGAKMCASTTKKLVAAMSTFYESLGRVEEMIKEFSTMPKESAEGIFLWKAIENEEAFSYLVEGFHRCQTKLDVSKKEFFLHPLRTALEEKFSEELEKKHLEYLKNVCVVNRQCIISAVQEAQILGYNTSNFSVKEEYVRNT